MTASLGSPPGGTLTAAQAATDDKFSIVDTSVGALDTANKTITVAEAKTLLAPSLTSTTPALVQHKKTSSSRGSSTQSFTLDSTPTVGNMLLYVVSGYSAVEITVPSGWAIMVAAANAVPNQAVWVLYRVVQSGDGTSWSFTTNTQPKNSSMIEVSGVKSWDYKVSCGVNSAIQQVGSISRGLADALVFFAVEVDGNHSSVTFDSGTTKLHDFVDGSTNHSGAFAQFDTVLTYSGSTLAAQTKATWNTGISNPIALTLALLGTVSLA